MPRPQSPTAAALAALCLGVLLASGIGDADASVKRQSPRPLTYQLADTWSDAPWALTAGRYGESADISSAPDATFFVLDTHNKALHAHDPDGTPTGVFIGPAVAAGMDPRRVDVGRTGDPWVLSVGTSGFGIPSRVDRVDAGGGEVASFDAFEAYSDLAVRANGWVYLVRPDESAVHGRPGVDVYDGDGTYRETISPEAMDVPLKVDVDLDGTIYVLHEVIMPSPPRERPPGPRPTAEPSDHASPSQAADPVSGVLVFTPDHDYVETVPFDFGLDVAAGPAGVFVARYGMVYALREVDPITPIAGQTWTGQISLDVPDDGTLRASLSHCSFQGHLTFDDPTARPATVRLDGALDRPALEGPVYPYRLAAGDGVAVLQGRFTVDGTRPAHSYATLADEPQSVQRWATDGRLEDQLGVCSGFPERSWARDVAVDGTDVLTVVADCVRLRPGYGFPAWSYCPRGLWGPDIASHVRAVAVDGQHVALLDIGSGHVVVLDRDGNHVTDWSIAGDGPAAPPVDLATRGDRVYLADRGSGMVRVRDLEGRPIADWPTHSQPTAIDVADDGDVFVLEQDGWALRFTPDGVLRAAWALPDRTVEARDIAAGSDGMVYIGYVDIGGSPDHDWRPIDRAGVWVFEPVEAESPDVVPPGAACRTAPDKRAAPLRLPLGDEVQVTLGVDGDCPDVRQPVKLVIVFDTSRSMNWDYTLVEAKAVVLALLAQLDPGYTQVSLVTFDDDGALIEPLTRDLVTVASRVSGLTAHGATMMAEGVALARSELATTSGAQGALPAILMVSDANPNDDVASELRAARADGITLWGLFFQDGQRVDDRFVSEFEDSGGDALIDPTIALVPELADRLVRAVPTDGLFERITVDDIVPGNMRYVEGSAQPAAAWDASSRTLSWALSDVRADDGVVLTYRLEPAQVGVWPTNLRADADYRDALGADGRLTFPIPLVEVYAPVTHTAYVPFGANQSCLRKLRPADVVLVMDTSSSMAEPAVGGGTKLDAARSAAGAFVRLLDTPRDRAAVVSFNTAAERRTDLTPSVAAVDHALESLAASPGTRIDLGLAEARRVLAGRARGDALPVVVLLTDGFQNGAKEPVLREAEALEEAGVAVFAIGLGANVDAALLGAVAGSPGRYFASPTELELASIYALISVRLRCAD